MGGVLYGLDDLNNFVLESLPVFGVKDCDGADFYWFDAKN